LDIDGAVLDQIANSRFSKFVYAELQETEAEAVTLLRGKTPV
jgi:hypothetical protein